MGKVVKNSPCGRSPIRKENKKGNSSPSKPKSLILNNLSYQNSSPCSSISVKRKNVKKKKYKPKFMSPTVFKNCHLKQKIAKIRKSSRLSIMLRGAGFQSPGACQEICEAQRSSITFENLNSGVDFIPLKRKSPLLAHSPNHSMNKKFKCEALILPIADKNLSINDNCPSLVSEIICLDSPESVDKKPTLETDAPTSFVNLVDSPNTSLNITVLKNPDFLSSFSFIRSNLLNNSTPKCQEYKKCNVNNNNELIISPVENLSETSLNTTRNDLKQVASATPVKGTVECSTLETGEEVITSLKIENEVEHENTDSKCVNISHQSNMTTESSASLITVDRLSDTDDDDISSITVINLDDSSNHDTFYSFNTIDITSSESIDLTQDDTVPSHSIIKSTYQELSSAKPRLFRETQTSFDLTLGPGNSSSGQETPGNLAVNLPIMQNGVLETYAQALLGDCFIPGTNKRQRRASSFRLDPIGSNIYLPTVDREVKKTGLRMVVIDGSNVAMSHCYGKLFSVEGLKICIDFFTKKGHEVKAFVPRFRNKRGKSSNPRLLDILHDEGSVIYTPSREIRGRMIASYDDRYIVQCAASFKGVIVSGDNFRDLLLENPSWSETIEQRLLPFTWVGNMIMFPQDPLGKYGPPLDVFLRHPA